jgi:hypothetical protein
MFYMHNISTVGTSLHVTGNHKNRLFNFILITAMAVFKLEIVRILI